MASEIAISDNVLMYAQDQIPSILSDRETIVFHVIFILFIVCPDDTFADSHTGTRLCVATCPGTVDSLAAPNLYGEPTTHTCVAKCLTPFTWADPHTR